MAKDLKRNVVRYFRQQFKECKLGRRDCQKMLADNSITHEEFLYIIGETV